MDFEVFPKSGFLGTQFGFKVISHDRQDRYRYDFGDGGSTDWIDGRTFVYRTFNTPGRKIVRMETRSGQVIEREVLVRDARRFGTGRVVGVDFIPGTKYLLVRLTTGIETFHLDNLQGLFVEVFYDEVYPVDHRRVFITRQQGGKYRIGLLDLETGRVTDEKVVGEVYHVYPGEHLVLYEAEGWIEVLDYRKWKVRDGVQGRHVTLSNDRRRVLYRHEDVYYLYDLDSRQRVEVGTFTVYFSLPPFDDHVILRSGDDRFVYWVDTERSWDLSRLEGKGFSLGSLGDLVYLRGEGVCLRVRDRPSYGTLLLRLLPSRRRRHVVETESSTYGVVQNLTLRLLRNIQRGRERAEDTEFVGFLGGAQFYQRRDGDRFIIVETSTEDVVLETPEEVDFLFEHEGRWVAVLNTDDETNIIGTDRRTTLIDVQTGKTLVQHEGHFEERRVPLLKEYGQLWVEDPLRKNWDRYTVYDGFSAGGGTPLVLSHIVGNCFVGRDEVRMLKNLREVRTFEGAFRGVSDRCSELVVERDGHLLLYVNLWSYSPTVHNLRDVDGSYTNVGFSPDGRFIALGKKGRTEILDLDTYEVVRVLNADFVRFNPDGRVMCSDAFVYDKRKAYWGKPRLFDPDTFEEVEPDDLCLYEFYSRDGRYGARLLSKDHVPIFRRGVGDAVLRIPTKTDPPSIDDLDFVNCVAFSPSSTGTFHVAVAGKPLKSGVTRVCEVQDGNAPSIKGWTDLPAGKAVWKCLFSDDGTFLGYYDSSPVTYLYRVSSISYHGTLKGTASPYSTLSGRSLECFSPNSACVVLSTRSYHAITLGGAGWVPTTTLYIATLEGEEVASFSEHTSDIITANFDPEGRCLVSRDEAGIVILRHLEEDVVRHVAPCAVIEEEGAAVSSTGH